MSALVEAGIRRVLFPAPPSRKQDDALPPLPTWHSGGARVDISNRKNCTESWMRSVLARTLEELTDISGNLFHDQHTAVLMREHGVSRICTRDTDFHRFPFVTVIDPLRQYK